MWILLDTATERRGVGLVWAAIRSREDPGKVALSKSEYVESFEVDNIESIEDLGVLSLEGH